MEELNKKLAEWAGLKWDRYKGKYQYPFDVSLDACFKWLVPKVRTQYHIHFHSTDGKAEWRVVLSNANETIYGRDNNPALALCKAIEKLINEETSNA